jgi:purine-binding chemotaxis protein CheW
MVEGPAPPGTAATPVRLVCFELRGQELALPIARVRETLTMRPITRVFLTPACLAGIFSLRGEIVPVVDLGAMLGMSQTVIGDDSRIVVVKHAGTIAGVVVDRLLELRTLDTQLEPPPPSLSPDIRAVLLGIAATPTGTVRVLDADAILGSDQLRALAGATGGTTQEGGSP